jgi:NAD(P)H-dependent flavin oxidoreductase YrpB (nitropropane dioxygenase family)
MGIGLTPLRRVSTSLAGNYSEGRLRSLLLKVAQSVSSASTNWAREPEAPWTPAGIAAALTLGASAVQIGTAFLRCSGAQTNAARADVLAEPEATVRTRAFSRRLGRSIETDYTRGAKSPEVPVPSPYPAQGGLTVPVRQTALAENDVQRMAAWAGQSAALARPKPAANFLRRIRPKVQTLLPGNQSS